MIRNWIAKRARKDDSHVANEIHPQLVAIELANQAYGCGQARYHSMDLDSCRLCISRFLQMKGTEV
jgi:hypothetical protein